MKKAIGIIEMYQHNEVLTHYCNLLLSSEYQIYVFCNENVFQDLANSLKQSNIIWITKPDNTSITDFFEAQKHHLNSCDYLLITTIFSEFRAFSKVTEIAHTTLVLHSALTWFEPLKHIKFRKNQKLSDTLRLLKFIGQGQLKKRLNLLKQVDLIALPNENILSYMQERVDDVFKSKMISLPFGAYHGNLTKDVVKDIDFTISGTVAPEVRDYEIVIEAFQKISDSLSKPIKICLLGKLKGQYGKTILKRFENLNPQKIDIIYFEDYITQDTYDQSLTRTKHLILPLRKYTQFYVFRELTCSTKLSGSVNDMIKYGIPSIVSQYCRINPSIDSILNHVSNANELGTMILKLSNQSQNESDYSTAFNSMSLDKLLEDFVKIYGEL